MISMLLLLLIIAYHAATIVAKLSSNCSANGVAHFACTATQIYTCSTSSMSRYDAKDMQTAFSTMQSDLHLLTYLTCMFMPSALLRKPLQIDKGS